ncbi:MAG: DUF362 domain-containing protein [Hydrogenoanaerobacterium sp.]
MNKVSILATDDYTPALLDASVERHFELLGLDSFLRAGMSVTLKPNLLMKRTPPEATTTHPEVVAAVVRALKRRGVTNITLADSPGGPYTVGMLNTIYKASGMTEMAQREGIALNTDISYVTLPTATKRVNSLNLISPVIKTDLLISICKLKTHCMTGLSGGVKNLFGCVPGLQKPEFHYRFKEPAEFCDMLVDICETVRPAITFVDAVVAMEGDGPSGGTAKKVGLTFCATNPYDLDVMLAKLIHMPVTQAKTVEASYLRGLAAQPADIELCGAPELINSVKDFKLPRTKSLNFNRYLPNFMQGALDKFTDNFVTPRPSIKKKLCIGCGKCAESCPAHTIKVEQGKAVINYEKCIKCYCCHEMCPVKAIDVRRNRFFNM